MREHLVATPVVVTPAAVLLFAAAAATAETGVQIDEAALVKEALSAAPPQVAKTARVMDLEGNLLREGTGAFTCFPAPPDLAGPMCLDEQWLAWMHAWMQQKPFTPSRIGFAYMLAGDTPYGGASNINPFDMEPTADNDWVVEGPHVMLPPGHPAGLSHRTLQPQSTIRRQAPWLTKQCRTCATFGREDLDTIPVDREDLDTTPGLSCRFA